MFNRKSVLLFNFILMVTPVFPSLSQAQEAENDLEAQLKQLEVLRQSGQFTEEELTAAKEKILGGVTKSPVTGLQIDGEYLVTFQEVSSSIRGEFDWLMPRQQPFGERSFGTKLWVIKRKGEQVNVDEYVYINNLNLDSLSDIMDSTKYLPTKQFVRKLPITKSVVDAQVARIQFSERSRALDGSITVDTTSLALRDNGSDGFAGEYKRTIVFQGSAAGNVPMVSQGTISLVRNIEDTNSKGADPDF